MNIRACERARPSQRVTHPSASPARRVADRAAAGERGCVPPARLVSPQTFIQVRINGISAARRTSVRPGAARLRPPAPATRDFPPAPRLAWRPRALETEFGYTPDVIFFPCRFQWAVFE